MILVDSSVWVDHLRGASPVLRELLERNRVIVHPFVISEIALESLRQREAVIALLDAMPRAAVATHGEVMGFIDRHGLYGQGIGYVDAHLLASAMLSDGGTLLTADKRLGAAAARLGIAA
ncbi:MAG: PIN domain-containing protein [Phyllobacteriaceae bacterium]|nr:PIN domain-containing protein [Phyllobacteriaceae bacterium]